MTGVFIIFFLFFSGHEIEISFCKYGKENFWSKKVSIIFLIITIPKEDIVKAY